jgi:hypothetical protein
MMKARISVDAVAYTASSTGALHRNVYTGLSAGTVYTKGRIRNTLFPE